MQHEQPGWELYCLISCMAPKEEPSRANAQPSLPIKSNSSIFFFQKVRVNTPCLFQFYKLYWICPIERGISNILDFWPP